MSTAPTIYGESIVMRVLDKQSLRLDLEALGMRQADRREVDRLIALPHGMVLVTGPTGSGKTTTLYAALSKLYDPRKKIITIEDPVEYELEGVNQIPVNPKRGLSFASGLRSILRQDPDVVMVGEIRDSETAEIAVRAAMTGHLILSTLHTNDAASAVGRMLDMGVEAFLLASVLEAVIAQRLGRRLAPRYAYPHRPTPAEWARLTPQERSMFESVTGEPIDSHEADQGVFKGRIGFYEVLTVTRGDAHGHRRTAQRPAAPGNGRPVAHLHAPRRAAQGPGGPDHRRRGAAGHAGQPDRCARPGPGDDPAGRRAGTRSFRRRPTRRRRRDALMPSYRVRCAGRGEGPIIDAPTRAAAIREVVRRGLTPLSVEPLDALAAARSVDHAQALPGGDAPGGDAGSLQGLAGAVLGSGRFGGTQRAAVMRELATGLEAGLPLVQSLRLIARQRRSKAQRAVLERVIDEVEHGRSLAEALASAPQLANDLTVSMVRAGEASGRLGEVLGQLADLLERDVRLRRALVGATTYPALLVVLCLASIVLVSTVIAPRILEEAAGAIDRLPWPTLVVQGFADLVLGWWWLMLSLAVVAVAGLVAVRRSEEGRLGTDRLLLRLPLVGLLVRDVAVSRFTRTLGTLTGSGIGLLHALRITRSTLGNKALEKVIDEVASQVSGGRTLAAPMEQSGYFPPMLVQIVAMGERSGRLEELLGHAARAMEERTEATLRMVTTLLPPLLVVAMAGVVGFIVLAILLPMLELQDVASQAM
ncbi:MAG: hypothetical protein KatS3mg103_0902 [Phycisphaerales bacterium]|nr:MAG: hypothetical protein KatS3mg103_0902 [Phycisphaerales bacterium]